MQLSNLEKAVADNFIAQGFKNQTLAYQKVRPNLPENSAQVRSSVVLNRPHVVEYLQEFRPKDACGKKITKDSLLQAACRITEKAEEKDQLKTALSGVELQGKFIGAFDQSEEDGQAYLSVLQKISNSNVVINVQQNAK